ncbi:hypothetical protein M7I_6540 [Glarea lozoyensis 74030]|uniref:Uncharacterized protein n=1 Tax=Glarea lozoyensis (strain ATCC 74030 / MF5533) TaxID=1104152 RepID=H0EUV1_GLAL7|nr:hypothetical protein M7I_6540 [Glarea lozoyensis 74030]
MALNKTRQQNQVVPVSLLSNSLWLRFTRHVISGSNTNSIIVDVGRDQLDDAPSPDPSITGPIIKRSKTLPKPNVRGVIIGVWRDSNELDVANKHVVFGFIDIHDRLRTRIYGMNRKREELVGNLPTGAGGCWVTFPKIIFDSHLKDLSPGQVKEYVKFRVQDLEDSSTEERSEELNAIAVGRAKAAVADGIASPAIVFEPHLADLTRQQMKEYTRIRLSDLAQLQDETDQERKLNEAKAVAQAKEIAARDDVSDKAIVQKAPTLEMETRHSARSEQRSQAKQQAEANAEVERTRKQKKEASEKQHKKTQKEISLDEASAQGAAQVELKNNMKKLNRIWKAQQTVTTPQAQASTATPPPPPEEVKYHNGIKYERKQTGVLQGKLVSAAQILNIDGEDYIEYRSWSTLIWSPGSVE